MATQKVQGTPPVGPIDIGGYAPGAVGKFDPFVPKKKDESKNKKKSVAAVTPVSAITAYANTDWETAAKEQYGGYYSIIEGSTELKELLKKAVEEKWSNSKFIYELQQTTWYKTTSDSARKWDVDKKIDPASAQQQIDNRSATIRESALKLGLTLDDATISKLSEDSLRGSWDQQVLNNAIGAEGLRSAGGVSQLRSGFIGNQLKQTASDYGVQLSDSTFNTWVEKIARGQENSDSFNQYALNTAKSLYPPIATQLDSGLTFQQIVDPYKQAASKALELNADSIDFTDPKWSKAINFITDKGEQRTMSSSEWGTYLRSDRSFGYEYTNEARSRAYQVTSGLANIFGKI